MIDNILWHRLTHDGPRIFLSTLDLQRKWRKRKSYQEYRVYFNINVVYIIYAIVYTPQAATFVCMYKDFCR
jgi:hypothetical protein